MGARRDQVDRRRQDRRYRSPDPQAHGDSGRRVSGRDWRPTPVAAGGESNVKEKLLQGYQANSKTFKAHLDGYNYLPFFKGEVQNVPREEYFYSTRAVT
jgi:arylsulfatase A-like enzyme